MRQTVEILADSVGPDAPRLTTFHLRLPRAAIWEDVLTHRDFSRNASSSRATPVKVMISRATWVPESWGVNKKGMGADRVLEGEAASAAYEAWERAMRACHESARELHELGVAKEDANLLLRPFEWLDAVVTSTRWENFLHQRARERTGQVRRQLRALAQEMERQLGASTPEKLLPGEWHLPYVTDEERMGVRASGFHDPRPFWLQAARASAMRCARTSIARVTDPEDFPCLEEDATSCAQKLVAHGHWSPLENQAMLLGEGEPRSRSNIDGAWKQLRKFYEGEYVS